MGYLYLYFNFFNDMKNPAILPDQIYFFNGIFLRISWVYFQNF